MPDAYFIPFLVIASIGLLIVLGTTVAVLYAGRRLSGPSEGVEADARILQVEEATSPVNEASMGVDLELEWLNGPHAGSTSRPIVYMSQAEAEQLEALDQATFFVDAKNANSVRFSSPEEALPEQEKLKRQSIDWLNLSDDDKAERVASFFEHWSQHLENPRRGTDGTDPTLRGQLDGADVTVTGQQTLGTMSVMVTPPTPLRHLPHNLLLQVSHDREQNQEAWQSGLRKTDAVGQARRYLDTNVYQTFLPEEETDAIRRFEQIPRDLRQQLIDVLETSKSRAHLRSDHLFLHTSARILSEPDPDNDIKRIVRLIRSLLERMK
ncbi:hypothetical protein CRI94_10610 [Longibacter salinarum]|uniref:Uncharacterized protein n=1 Tax=Longibacter salinarum TaxID=1850348 RepID=A0A2A8CWS3_9BACT|nr:hypothetical protein [Longibacter salinarum]PEN13096.1 hypothetical protein CRI94_10610 [Longibacter salinarum]